jgi:hypothetical protein
MISKPLAIAALDSTALTKILRNDSIELSDNIPKKLKSKKGWLLYKTTIIRKSDGTVKINKVPYYANKRKRNGVQGSPADLNQLATFDEVFQTLKNDESFAGMGFAILPPFGVIAYDGDKCVEIVDDQVRFKNPITQELISGTYAEISPSETGVRALFLGQATSVKNVVAGHELFGSSGFVTITGDQISKCNDIQPLSDERRELLVKYCTPPALRKTNTPIVPVVEQPITKGILADLKSALEFIPSDDRELWVKILHALKILGEAGRALAREWSAKSSLFDPNDFDRVWNSCKPRQTSYKAVFAEAQRQGWVNPSSGIVEIVKLTPTTKNTDVKSLFNNLVLTNADVIKMEDAKFLVPNMIVQGHVAAFIAEANGGKTTIFVYLCEQLARNGMDILYINVDGSPSDLKRHHAHSINHGYKVIAPDAKAGKSTEDVIAILRAINEGEANCKGLVIIVDTLKKFVNLIQKNEAKKFYQLLRGITVKGATICLLGHSNKYKDENGKQIFEGTADLRNDVDELIYLDAVKDENALIVTTRPDKVRAEFSSKTFSISLPDRVVTELDEVIKIRPKEDREMLGLIKAAIQSGRHKQLDIVGFVIEHTSYGEKKIRGTLKRLVSEGLEIEVRNTGVARELFYSLRPSLKDKLAKI